MKKSISNVEQMLSKAVQRQINGGLSPFSCESICSTTLVGTHCESPYCTDQCNGRDGWINL